MGIPEAPPEFHEFRDWFTYQLDKLGPLADAVTSCLAGYWNDVEEFWNMLISIPAMADTDLFREKAADVWGTSRTWADATGGQLLDVCARLGLGDDGKSRRVLDQLWQNWQGDGANACRERLGQIHASLATDAAEWTDRGEFKRYPIVGDALTELAETFEVTWADTVNGIISYWGTALAIAGVSGAALAAAAAELLLGVVGLVLGLIAIVITALVMQQNRIGALLDFQKVLPALTAKQPGGI